MRGHFGAPRSSSGLPRGLAFCCLAAEALGCSRHWCTSQRLTPICPFLPQEQQQNIASASPGLIFCHLYHPPVFTQTSHHQPASYNSIIRRVPTALLPSESTNLSSQTASRSLKTVFDSIQLPKCPAARESLPVVRALEARRASMATRSSRATPPELVFR